MKEYYKIGEISNLYEIGTDSLRYYEELGILSPKRDSNGYRMYNIGDIRTLNVLRELRAVGFSMAEIKAHLKDFNLEKTMALFKQEIETIKKKKKELDKLEKQLTFRITEIEDSMALERPSEKPEIVRYNQRKILSLNDNVYRDADLDFVIKKLQKKTENQLYIIGNGHIGASIPLDYITKGEYGHFTSVFSVVDEAETQYDKILPAGDYLCSTIRGSYATMGDAWKRFFDALDQQSLVAESDPLELYIIDNHDTSDESEYITLLQVKIKS